MVTIEIQYEGELHCRAVHEPSQTMLATDAPADNQGRGASFSPTDLIATGLATCIVTTMAIAARTLGHELTHASASVTKEMTTEGPRRIARLATRVRIQQPFDEGTQRKLERAAHTCPVHKALHPDVDAPITIVWSDGAV